MINENTDYLASSNSRTSISPSTILAEIYKGRAKESNESCKKTTKQAEDTKEDNAAILSNIIRYLNLIRLLLVEFYDRKLQRGVRKSACLSLMLLYIVEMNKSSTLGSVFESAKKLFFKNIEGELMLGDSYGTVTRFRTSNVVIGNIL